MLKFLTKIRLGMLIKEHVPHFSDSLSKNFLVGYSLRAVRFLASQITSRPNGIW